MSTRNPQSDYPVKNGFSVDMFSDAEIRQIHNATLETLTEMGMHITNDEALDIFADAGADVDRDSGRVKIPPYMIDDALRSAPPEVLLAGRDPENDVVVGDSRVNFTTFGAGVHIIDHETGEFRDTTKQDVADTALLADYLDQVDVYSHAVTGGDCPSDNVDLHEAEAFLNNTSKHCMHIDLTCGENAKKYFEMGAAIVGGMDELRDRPIISALVCPQSPYELHGDAAQIIIECARAGVPVNVLSMAMGGATSPITLAGTLVDHNAEVLTGITLAQLVNRGAPVLYGSSTTAFDVKESTSPVGNPELGMINASVARLARYYNLPSYTAGG
ncbi:trimethylamine:corrinoid methyltransferase [Halarsenatibacter silvermanii]|uniref:Trimethylamine:corrinoid methyltransferase n=1 Tax=Halarsenatibacter silvermanii TaxID=321763 RepID=A0A1G9HAQ9_9FIRM|nr:trimethylamine:corrinoid methyltransferase [Halarsenatibacter silvermanii]